MCTGAGSEICAGIQDETGGDVVIETRAGARTQTRAWVRLPSGTRLDLLDPTPFDWTDEDLAIGLARTYRWGGHSVHALPLSVAQHSLLVLALRQGAARPAMVGRDAARQPPVRRVARREMTAGHEALGRAAGAEAHQAGPQQDLLKQGRTELAPGLAEPGEMAAQRPTARRRGVAQDTGEQAIRLDGMGHDSGRASRIRPNGSGHGAGRPSGAQSDGLGQEAAQPAVASQGGIAQEPGQAWTSDLSAPIARRELLHDADEGLLGFDPISPLKPFLGPGYAALAGRLQGVIARRYALPDWTLAEKRAHKRADRVAAASEAVHVAGWTREEVRRTLRITEPPEDFDPLAACFGVTPWVPWPADQAAERFLAALRRLNGAG